jgi:serine O-acetyltransferase
MEAMTSTTTAPEDGASGSATGSGSVAPLGPLALWWSDYEAYCSHKPPESVRRKRLLALPRLLVNPALRANLLLRVANSSPRATWWIWRNAFVHWYAMDWSGALTIGPGFELPHPIGTCLPAGAVIGADVRLGHNVTLAGDARSQTCTIEDRAVIFPGSMIVGGITIGHDTVVSANCVVTRSVPPQKLVTQRGVLPRVVSPVMRDGNAAADNA